MAASSTDGGWPALSLPEVHDTLETLHRRVQIVGKTRLALAPMVNHWWQVTQYVTARGLTTSPMPCGAFMLEVEFDFIEHRLIALKSTGEARSLPLRAQSVAEFYQEYRDLLRSLGVEASINPVPQEMSDTLRFDQDRGHASYDPAAARRLWEVIAVAHRALSRFRGSFLGKCSPVHFWWGGFDLSCTRFSGRVAPPHPGGIANLSDRVTREAYSHECISAGWWPGDPSTPVNEPVFYAYAYPEPAGCAEAPVRPSGASYQNDFREWMLPYDRARRASDPESFVLEFLQCTYETAANLGGWNREELERSVKSDRGAKSVTP